MTDIVKRLRGHFLVASVDDTLDQLLQEAAVEIERLRWQLEANSNANLVYAERNAQLAALNAELVAVLTECADRIPDWATGVNKELIHRAFTVLAKVKEGK